MSFTVLVCGGRAFDDAAKVVATLDGLRARYGALTVVEGGGTGADALTRSWRALTGSRGRSYPVDRGRRGKAAKPRRNAEMLADSRPQLVVAFVGGPGTADMVRRAYAAGVDVMEVA